MSNYVPAYEDDMQCVFTGHAIKTEYFLSNKGRVAGWDAVELANPDEAFVYVNLEDFSRTKDAEPVMSVSDLIGFINAHPYLDIIYIYDLASAAYNFTVDENGLHFFDGLDNAETLPVSSDYLFYLNGLRLKVKGD